jgi:hypothetical protein
MKIITKTFGLNLYKFSYQLSDSRKELIYGFKWCKSLNGAIRTNMCKDLKKKFQDDSVCVITVGIVE